MTGVGAPAGIDWSWALGTGGNLSPRQKRQLLLPLARTVVRYAASRGRTATGRRGAARLDLDAPAWPDSRLTRDAEAEAREVLTPHTLEHSYRTYLFGRLLASLAGARVDEEAAFVASLLHDLNLEHRTPGRCFAVVGGERAERFAAEHGATPQRARTIGAAVAGHISGGALEDLDDVGGLVSIGAFADLTGFGIDPIDPAWVDDLHRRHPRLGIRRHVLRAWKEEGRAVPDGRARWLTRYGAFPLLLRAAPYAE